MRTLIVDDEYLALNLLETFISKTPGLELVAKTKSPIEALEILEREQVDLLFLDIQMPELTGNKLLKSLHNPPQVVFTTAYSDYAIEAFELNVLDYLLKPFSFERFLQAVNKAKITHRQKLILEHSPTVNPDKSAEFITIKVDGKIVKLKIEEIFFVEGLKEYVRLVCQSGRYVTFERMKNLEAMLPDHLFIRVHKSYIVAHNHVRALNGNRLEINEYLIPVSRSKREEVVEKIFGSRKG
ncbi:MAG: LytTR family DNA-binding domain-containing protein [Chitinophagales bacterium]|nr:LytTR family DNA-binding domain-containing protein [Chitinophagales bacterium]